MLVLSRKENQTLQFPSLGITIEVLRTNMSGVRLGIEAPPSVRVIRGELEDRLDSTDVAAEVLPAYDEQHVREKLESAKLAIHLSQNQLRQGLETQAEIALDEALQLLESLNELLKGQRVEENVVRENRTGYRTTGQRFSPITVTKNELASIIDEYFPCSAH